MLKKILTTQFPPENIREMEGFAKRICFSGEMRNPIPLTYISNTKPTNALRHFTTSKAFNKLNILWNLPKYIKGIYWWNTANLSSQHFMLLHKGDILSGNDEVSKIMTFQKNWCITLKLRWLNWLSLIVTEPCINYDDPYLSKLNPLARPYSYLAHHHQDNFTHISHNRSI